MVIPNVERVQSAALNGGQDEVFLVLAADHAGFGGGHNINSAGPKAANQVSIHGVFVHVEAKAAHIGFAGAGNISSAAASSAAMSLSTSA
jgi:hypothetical protein